MMASPSIQIGTRKSFCSAGMVWLLSASGGGNVAGGGQRQRGQIDYRRKLFLADRTAAAPQVEENRRMSTTILGAQRLQHRAPYWWHLQS